MALTLPIAKIGERSVYHNFLIYGDAGVGKTVLAGSAQAVIHAGPVLFVDIEAGTNSLLKTYPDVDSVRISTWKELQDIYDYLVDEDHGYKTVVIDSLTEAQKINMYFIMKRAGLEPGEDKSGWDEYNMSLEHMNKFVRAFRDLPMNVIFTALADSERDKMGKLSIFPFFTGKFKKVVAGLLDEVFYLYIKELYDEETKETSMHRLLLTSATETTIGKDRSGQLPQVILDPTMDEIFRIMKG